MTICARGNEATIRLKLAQLRSQEQLQSEYESDKETAQAGIDECDRRITQLDEELSDLGVPFEEVFPGV